MRHCKQEKNADFHCALHSFIECDKHECWEQFSTCVRSFRSEEGLYGKSFFTCSLVTTSLSSARQPSALIDALLVTCSERVGTTGHDVCSLRNTAGDELSGLLSTVVLA